MKKLTLSLGLLSGLAAITSLTLTAQVRRNDNNRDQVCVYENNNYTGWQQCFLPGEQMNDLGGHRNQISSIRVYGNARVTVYANKNFEGGTLDVNSDLNDLAQQRVGAGGLLSTSWNDSIESLRVTSRTGTSVYDRRDDVYNRDNRDTRNDPRDIYTDDRNGRNNGRGNNSVCIYEDANYRGRSECFDSGDEVADLGRRASWNDRVSSIRIYGSGRVTLYRDISFRGDRITIDRDIPDLRRLRMNGSLTWDNQVSSLDINGGRGRAYGRDNARGYGR